MVRCGRPGGDGGNESQGDRYVGWIDDDVAGYQDVPHRSEQDSVG
jgi:hypothetical protein